MEKCSLSVVVIGSNVQRLRVLNARCDASDDRAMIVFYVHVLRFNVIGVEGFSSFPVEHNFIV